MTSSHPSPPSDSPSDFPQPADDAAGFAESAETESPARKSGGFMRKFFLALLLAAAGAGAYVYYFNPAAITAALPDFIPLPEFITQRVADAKKTPSPAPAPTRSPTSTTSPAPTESDADRAGENARMAAETARKEAEAKVEELSAELAALRAEFARMESRLNQVDAAARVARAANSANIRLLMVGLLLESNGDTQSAAAALRRIADESVEADDPEGNPVPPELAQLVRAEALRLEQTPGRNRILDQIAELRRLLEKEQATAEAPDAPTSVLRRAGDFLRGAFNVSRREAADAEKHAGRRALLDRLARMEFYLAANNRDQYRLALESAAEMWEGWEGGEGLKTEGADPNINLKFQLLSEFGAPDYRLHLPLDKP